MSRVLPILFNTDMVRAILSGKKMVTRRVVKGDINTILHSPYHAKYPEVPDNRLIEKLCNMPYQLGDILYVRETWQYMYDLDGNDQIIEETGRYVYAADGFDVDTWVNPDGTHRFRIPWRPSIHMPKDAARIWLKVTDVRAERLQNITEEGAKAEGANWRNGKNVGWEEKMKRTSIDRFAEIWDSTIKKKVLPIYGWNANPWVWRIEFERCEKPQEVD